MNKTNRRKKKKDKKIAWDAECNRLKRYDKDIDRNGEGYRDSTAAAALRNLIRQGW